MTEVLDRTSRTAPELLALCDLAANEQDYLSAYHHASMAYRLALGYAGKSADGLVLLVEKDRIDREAAARAAGRACLLSAKLDYPESSAIVWIQEGVKAIQQQSNFTLPNIAAQYVRLYTAGNKAGKAYTQHCETSPQRMVKFNRDYSYTFNRYAVEVSYWSKWLEGDRLPAQIISVD